ncbi:N-acetyl sugar amidotransferase [Paucibacter oligotrophus]|uniref:N-acetyl sugar amidotransferase n=2 Tax=Roseateles oligotrophus TaxID=1769250 RepID=A0ABT2YDX4_9BURK|nr:N-acetyl sugar amidotransferase [Roseateles oligotrophus]
MKSYRICTRCVMDTSVSDIRFDSCGLCNYCTEFSLSVGKLLARPPEAQQFALDAFIANVKSQGRGKPYDCIVGVSGGLDSSWTLVQAKRLGLRPLAVHMDNGWNSELAQSNIENLVKKLDVDLYTHVIDWSEYRGLMQTFFDADVIDVELLYDNAMLAVNYEQAVSRKVKYILAGTNQATEGLRIPSDWNWFKFDARNIRGISKRFDGPKLTTFPAIGAFRNFWYQTVQRYRWVSFLDYLDYTKASALVDLQLNFNYKPYPYKHYESVFTRFYQGYILPQKFGVDKRRVHLSALVVSGQMGRNEALAMIEQIPYPTLLELEADKAYFLKKMGWTSTNLQEYLARPTQPHSLYPSEREAWNRFMMFYGQFRRLAGLSVGG